MDYACRSYWCISSDPSSLLGISTASNAASQEDAFVSESRLTRQYLNNFMETSDVSYSSERYYVYILFSLKDKGLYIGYTSDLKQRLMEHARARVTATKFRIPLKLIHYEYFIDRTDAKAREKFLKSGFGRQQFFQILKRTMNKIV